ncbi:MAG: PleD family two-component system response regulator [Cyanophyceae cyanobacterium]
MIQAPSSKAPLTNLEKLSAVVAKIRAKQATGHLTCSTKQVRINLFFYRGRLLWLTDDRSHRVRRWLRVTKGILSPQRRQQVPKSFDSKELWESQNLSQQLLDGELDMDTALGILKQALVETLFAIEDCEPMSRHWRAGSGLSGSEEMSMGSQLALPHQVFEEAVQRVSRLQQEWQVLGLSRSVAYEGLLLDKEKFEASSGNNSTLLSMRTMFSGQRSFWDLLHHFSESPTVAVRLLQHFLQQEILSFCALSDRQLHEATVTKAKKAVATVLCVDDSVQSAELVKQQCHLKGLKAILCHDPLKAVPVALETQPDLILLDVMMPIVNGHELCAQLRRVKSLENVPIVMLTGQSSLGDRFRSKIVKASGFVSKPLTAQKLQTVIEKHISQVAKSRTSQSQPPLMVANLIPQQA